MTAEARDVAANYCLEFDPTYYFRPRAQETTKGGRIEAPNSCVLFLVRKLDGDDQVASFRVSDIVVEYWHPIIDEICGTTIDLEVVNKDGTRRLLYVTPQLRMHTDIESNIIEAARDVAKSMKAKLEVWTEVEIFGDNPLYMKSLIRYLMDEIYLKFNDEPSIHMI